MFTPKYICTGCVEDFLICSYGTVIFKSNSKIFISGTFLPFHMYSEQQNIEIGFKMETCEAQLD